jgi:hypothetical protein
MAKGGSEPTGVWLEGQEVPGEHRDAVDCGYCESSTHRHPSRKRRGLRRARCVATRTAGSEVRTGETGRWQRRHRAPARPYDRRVTRLADRPPDSSGRSTRVPFSNRAPAPTSATRWGALSERHRACADSMSSSMIRCPGGGWVAEDAGKLALTEDGEPAVFAPAVVTCRSTSACSRTSRPPTS